MQSYKRSVGHEERPNESRDSKRSRDHSRSHDRDHKKTDIKHNDSRHKSSKHHESRNHRSRDYDSKHHSHKHDSRHSDSKQHSHDSYKEKSKETKNDEKSTEKPKPIKKEEPNFSCTGKLAEDTNVFNGVVVKYNQPPEAAVPKKKWRLYPFKGEESLPFINLYKQSAFLLGRDRKVADIPIDHPSCSKQHAVIQFRCVEYERPDQTIGKKIKPYLIDLDSSNGTFLDNKQIESRRYYELFEMDVIKFGFSSREYVLLHEDSQGVKQEVTINDQ